MLTDTLAQLEQELTAEFDKADQASAPLTTLAAITDLVTKARELNPQAPTQAGTTTSQSVGVAATKQVARPSLAQLRGSRPTTHPASSRPRTPRHAVTASMHIPTGEESIAIALFNALRQGGRNLVEGTPAVIASATWDYPSNLQLGDDDPDKVTAAMQEQIHALVAYGGICEPVAVDYAIPTFTSDARPLRDGLASFQATRGGVRFTPSPKLSQITPPTPWTVAMDAGGTATKSCQVITCPTPQEQVVYGIPTCTTMGNMQQRYNPELVQAWLDLTAAAAARTAELSLLQLIEGGSTALTDVSHGLGAARDLLPAIDRAAAGLRYRHRTVRESPTIRVILPDFVKDLLRADIAKELAHDYDTPQTDALALAEQRIDAWFSERNINPIWTLEASTAPPFTTQAAGALAAWPTNVTFTMFHDGAWVFLDGGRLDVGLIRDSTLNAQNNVQMFLEDFESVAFRGVESVKVTMPLSATGASSGGVVPS